MADRVERVGRRREQHGILGHRDDVLDVGGLEQVEDRGGGEAAVQADPQPRVRKRGPEFRQQAQQEARHAHGGGRGPGAQQRRDQVLPGLVVKGQERDERQVAPAAIEAVEEGELLRAVRGILGEVEIDRDPPRLGAPSAMLRDDGIGQRLAQAEQRARRDRILEAREGGLRRQARAVDRIAIQQQLVDGVVGQGVRVIRVGVPAREAEDALREEIPHGMAHAGRVPSVAQDARQRVDQAQATVRGLEQDRAAVRTRVGLVEGGDEGLGNEIREENRLCYRGVVQQRRLRVAKGTLQQGLSTMRRRFCFYSITTAPE